MTDALTLSLALSLTLSPFCFILLPRKQKACAFIEFERTDSARRAIQASMRPSDGGEGGIHIPVSSPAGATTVIHIVEKKNPGERPASRPHTRGGGAAGSGGRSQTGAPRSGGGGAGEEGGAGGRGQGQGQGAGRGGKTGGGGGGSGRGAKGSGGGASKSASASATTTGSAAK